MATLRAVALVNPRLLRLKSTVQRSADALEHRSGIGCLPFGAMKQRIGPWRKPRSLREHPRINQSCQQPAMNRTPQNEAVHQAIPVAAKPEAAWITPTRKLTAKSSSAGKRVPLPAIDAADDEAPVALAHRCVCVCGSCSDLLLAS